MLAGCKVGPNYRRPQVKVPEKFGELDPGTGSQSPPSLSRAAGNEPPVDAWWRTFKDPELDRLIGEGVRQNLDLRIATERIRQARAQRRLVAAGLLPEIDANAGYNRARGSKNVVLPLGGGSSGSGSGAGSGSPSPKSALKTDPPGDPPSNSANGAASSGSTGSAESGNMLSPFGQGGLPSITTELFQIGFDSTWELDIFGGTRRRVEAATADLAAAAENRRDMLVTLLAEVARNYLELRGTQQRLAVARENLAAQRETLDLVQSMRRSGLVSDLDTTRAAAQVALTAATIPPMEGQTRLAIHALSTLLAKQPEALSAELEQSKPLPILPPTVPVGLPSQLLLRRPDIRRAERQLQAATARIGSAKADLFPKFALTGSAGLDSSSLTHLLDWESHYFLISPTVVWPIFDAGRITSNIKLQESVRSQFLLQYRSTILAALREVEDALVQFDTEQARRAALSEALNQSRRTFEIAREQYQHGLVDFLTVLDSQRTVLNAEEALTQSDQTAATDLVALYKALGGGWATDHSP